MGMGRGPGLQERHSELWFKLKIILVSSKQNKTQDITARLERTIQGCRAIHVHYTPSNLSIPTTSNGPHLYLSWSLSLSLSHIQTSSPIATRHQLCTYSSFTFIQLFAQL